MKLLWNMVEDVGHVGTFVAGQGNGSVEFRVTHDHAIMSWVMRGKIEGISEQPITIRRSLPDNGEIPLEAVLEVFKQICEWEVSFHSA